MMKLFTKKSRPSLSGFLYYCIFTYCCALEENMNLLEENMISHMMM